MVQKEVYVRPLLSRFRETLSLLSQHLLLFLPDLLLLVFTGLFTSLFLYVNGLWSTFFLSQFQQHYFADKVRLIFSETPKLITLILSFVILLSLNIIVGLQLVALRYEFVRASVAHERFRLFSAYRRARKHIPSLFILKFILGLLYTLPLLFVTWIQFRFPSPLVSAILFTLLGLFWAFLYFSFFFAYPIVYQTNRGIRAFRLSVQTFFRRPKYTIMAVLVVTLVQFILTFIFTTLPSFWIRFALHYGYFIYTPYALGIIGLLFLVFTKIWFKVWEATFSFSCYKDVH